MMARMPDTLEVTLPDGRVIPVGLRTTTSLPVVGYIIAERHISGPDASRLDADWDGLIHETREAAEAELAKANRCLDESDPRQEPSDHWKLYELREVQRP